MSLIICLEDSSTSTRGESERHHKQGREVGDGQLRCMRGGRTIEEERGKGWRRKAPSPVAAARRLAVGGSLIEVLSRIGPARGAEHVLKL